jgi:hypothetical protein
MGAVAILKALIPDEVTSLEKRSADCQAELASIGASQIVHERELHSAELHGNIKAGDAAAAKLESATKQIDRLRVRRSAIAEALASAKASAAATSKAERVTALKAEAARAGLAADMAQGKAVALCLELSKALSVYASEGDLERAAAQGIERETGTAVGYARRYLSGITSEALRQAGTLNSFDLSLPVVSVRN